MRDEKRVFNFWDESDEGMVKIRGKFSRDKKLLNKSNNVSTDDVPERLKE